MFTVRFEGSSKVLRSKDEKYQENKSRCGEINDSEVNDGLRNI